MMLSSVIVSVLLNVCWIVGGVATPFSPSRSSGMQVRTVDTPLRVDTSTTRPSTVTSTTTAFSGCGGVARCLGDPQCSQCLDAINATSGFPHTHTEFNSLARESWQALDDDFFRVLQSTVVCSPNTTHPGILHAALQDLCDVTKCSGAYGMWVSNCLLPEYACFVDSSCRQCFAALSAAGNGNGIKTEVFRTPACIATSYALQTDLTLNCGGESFPACTFRKQQCTSLTECKACLSVLDAGGGAEAARQCTGAQPSAIAMDNVVEICFGSDVVSCDFWRQRCAQNVNCAACLAHMTNEDNAQAIASEWAVDACQKALQDDVAVSYLNSITTGCPDISTCRRAVVACVFDSRDTCIACINGSAPPSQAAVCSILSYNYLFDTMCRPCTSSVNTINLIVFATATVGLASAVVCLLVTVTIFAHGRDRASMRDRIVVGLMLANVVYSTANVIPLNALRTNIIDCGRLAMSFDAIRIGRAWWFCGKYGLVSFELLILGASIRAELRGMSAVPRCAEATMHVACCSVAVLAFVVFYTLCAGINADGYNMSTENEGYTNVYNHASIDDDFDDDTPAFAGSLKFQNGRDKYDNLVRDMLLAWDVLVGVAVVLWVVLRLLHRYALQALQSEAAAAARAEANDVWADTRRSVWEARRQLLQARRDAFAEVAKPLEPYIIVFMLFAAPAFLMSTSWCQRHSGANAASSSSLSIDSGSVNFTYGTCDVWCEFVLAFRSLGTVAVFLFPRKRREELVGIYTTFCKLCIRLGKCIRCGHDGVGLLSDHDEEVEMLPFRPTNDGADGTASVAAALAETLSWCMNESDFITTRRLGQGAFGEVWEGKLRSDGRAVAVKILFAGGVDEDGDLVDPNADEDFRKECVALQRVDSPHLIKFLGFGTTAGGNGFIVTEFMSGGSLQDVLHDFERDLPWRKRVRISLQVALGMEHLHQRRMLHRDLKSANVLVDDELNRAKVCDFGMSRVVRPARTCVVRSPFTGMKLSIPNLDSLVINDKNEVLSPQHITVSFSDAHGTMTKAAGTLLWMAPEIFRGDQHYTRAVDVFSFGMVLWELTTRETPWEKELSSDRTTFFEQLNSALQTGRRPAISDDAVSKEYCRFVVVMNKCWAADPANRPSFADAARDLAEILSTVSDPT